VAKVFKRSYVDAKGRKRKSPRYYGWFRDADGIRKRKALFTDKTASEQELLRLQCQADQQQTGIADTHEESHKRSLREHLSEFSASIRHDGCSEDYVKQIESRISRVLDGCRFRRIGDLSASRLQEFLSGLKAEGLGQRTVNHYLTATKQFSAWLVKDNRTKANRLAHVKAGNAKLDVRRERRELSDGEIRWLLDTARNCTSHRFSLPGELRHLLYAAALGTGLRAKELASLTRGHFDLDAEIPSVRIDAADEKSRRGDTIPLPADLVSLLRPRLASIDRDDPVWPGTWAENKRAGKAMQGDLRAARKAWIAGAATDEERAERERTDFLRYRDSKDRYADFHALRHTYLSRLGRSGASAKAMQKLARHTTVELTIGRYTHADLTDLAFAVNGMTPLPVGTEQVKEQHEPPRPVAADNGPSLYTIESRRPSTGPLLARAIDASCHPLMPADDFQRNPTKPFCRQPTSRLPSGTHVPDSSCGRLRSHERKSGSGWESNPPGLFSEATPGLKPGAVTRSAYTPEGVES
jgi:integrase